MDEHEDTEILRAGEPPLLVLLASLLSDHFAVNSLHERQTKKKNEEVENIHSHRRVKKNQGENCSTKGMK